MISIRMEVDEKNEISVALLKNATPLKCLVGTLGNFHTQDKKQLIR